MPTSGSSGPSRSNSATATSRSRSRSAGVGRGHGVDDEPQSLLGLAGVERCDDGGQLARRAELLEQRVGPWWGEQLVEERVDRRRATSLR